MLLNVDVGNNERGIKKLESVVEKIVAKTIQVEKTVKILTTLQDTDGSKFCIMKMQNQ